MKTTSKQLSYFTILLNLREAENNSKYDNFLS